MSGITKGRQRLLVLVFGFSPLWLALEAMILGSSGHGPDYWNVVPWLTLLAIPVCGVTTLITLVAIQIASRRAPEDRPRAKPVGSITLVGVALLVLAVGAGAWHRYQGGVRDSVEEKRQVVEHVRSDPDVHRIAGDPFTAWVRFGNGDPPRDYHVSVDGRKKFHAIVDVHRTAGAPTFAIRCLTYRDSEPACAAESLVPR